MKTDLLTVLNQNFEQFAQKLAYAYLKDGEEITEQLTFKALEKRVHAVAGYLQQQNCSTKQALLIFENGLDYVTAFLSCIYAKTVAVPLHPIGKNKPISRIRAIAQDSEATHIISNRIHFEALKKHVENDAILARLQWIFIEDIDNTPQ